MGEMDWNSLDSFWQSTNVVGNMMLRAGHPIILSVSFRAQNSSHIVLTIIVLCGRLAGAAGAVPLKMLLATTIVMATFIISEELDAIVCHDIAESNDESSWKDVESFDDDMVITLRRRLCWSSCCCC